jgi:uncharacterized beta-barrel protein YwiB (DUF1934 family)
MSQDESVSVAIRLESRHDGEETVTEYAGTLFRKPQAIYIRYEESGEDGAKSAVTVRYDGKELKIVRHGEVDGEQSFAPGKRLAGSYRSPFAKLRLTTETSQLAQTGGENGNLPFTLDWHYDLWINEEWTSRAEVRLHIREV